MPATNNNYNLNNNFANTSNQLITYDNKKLPANLPLMYQGKLVQPNDPKYKELVRNFNNINMNQTQVPLQGYKTALPQPNNIHFSGMPIMYQGQLVQPGDPKHNELVNQYRNMQANNSMLPPYNSSGYAGNASVPTYSNSFQN